MLIAMHGRTIQKQTVMLINTIVHYIRKTPLVWGKAKTVYICSLTMSLVVLSSPLKVRDDDELNVSPGNSFVQPEPNFS